MKYINKLGQYEYPDRGVFYTIDIQTIIWDKSEELKYVYTGQLLPETDIFDGICMIVYNNGSIFEGYYRDDYKDGRGRYIWPDGRYYVGEWKKGMKNGKGELHFYNGDVFIGNFLNDKMHGEGTWKFVDQKIVDKISTKSNDGSVKVKYIHGKLIRNESS